MPNSTKKIKQHDLSVQVSEKKDLAEKRTEKGTFMIGHNYSQKYPPKVAEDIFQRMWAKLIEDEGTSEPNLENPVRANSIKLIKEVCLCCGISHHVYTRLKNIYASPRDLNGDQNPNFNETIFDLIKKIEEVCESRLVYSGQLMDLFVLKNHYGYVDKIELVNNDQTTVVFFTLPDGTKLPI